MESRSPFGLCLCHFLLYSHMQIHAEHNDTMIMTTRQWRRATQFLEKYTSHFIWKVCVCERELETEQNCNILTLTLLAITVFLSRSLGLLNRGPECPAFCWVLTFSTTSCHQRVSKLTDFLSSPSYMIVQSLTQYIPITGYQDVSLPLSLEWHAWLSPSGNNCHAVHRSLSSSASVYDCTVGFYLVPYCQPSPPTLMEYATSTSFEWHVWPGQWSIYNNHPLIIFQNSTCGIFFTSVSITRTRTFYRTILRDNNSWKQKKITWTTAKQNLT